MKNFLRNWRLMIAIGLVASAPAIAAFLLGPSDAESFYIRHVEPLDDDRLLLVMHSVYTYRSSDDTYDTRRSSGLMITTTTGQVLARETESDDGRRWNIHGISAGVIWLMNDDKDVYARKLSDLSLVPEVEEAIASHPMLSRKHDVVGTFEGGLVLFAADHHVYLLHPDGHLEQRPDLRCRHAEACTSKERGEQFPISTRFEIGRPRQILRSKPEGLRIKVDEDLRLIKPEDLGVVMDHPTSILVERLDFEGRGSSRLLSRVAGEPVGRHDWLANRILWTKKVRELLDPSLLDGNPGVWVSWARSEGDRVRAIIEARWASGRNSKYAHHIVELDAETGAPLASYPIADPEED